MKKKKKEKGKKGGRERGKEEGRKEEGSKPVDCSRILIIVSSSHKLHKSYWLDKRNCHLQYQCDLPILSSRVRSWALKFKFHLGTLLFYHVFLLHHLTTFIVTLNRTIIHCLCFIFFLIFFLSFETRVFCVCEKYFLLPKPICFSKKNKIRFSLLLYWASAAKCVWDEACGRGADWLLSYADSWVKLCWPRIGYCIDSCYTALHGIIPLWASVLNTTDHKIPFHFCCINIGSQIVWLFLAALGILAKRRM